MTSKKATTARGRTLGAELRELRDRSGLSTRAAAARVGWTAAMLNRTENGLRATNPEEVASILGAYGVTGSERERLLALARDAELPGWWEVGDNIYPAPLKALIGFETQAIRMTDVETTLIPGLLQTAEYVRAIMQACDVPSLEAEMRVATRLGRQAILSRPAPPKLLAFVDEASLRRPVGGPRVMAEQVRHIRQSAAKPNITVRIIPFHVGAHAALSGPFTILEFERARPLIHQEGKNTLSFVDSSAEVDEFRACVDTLRATSLTPDRSIEYLDSIIADHGRQEPA
ncbi:helix-turn-helix transcriptional regulator [Spirillospora sp. NPDC052269]